MWFILIVFGLFSSKTLFAESNRPQLQELLLPNLEENLTIRLNCNLLKGSNVKLEWYFNDNKIEDSSRRRIKLSEDTIDLTIKKLETEDLGDYKCIGTNDFGSDIKKVSLYFNVKPKWLKEPENLVASLFKEITLECETKGYPSPINKWIKLSNDKKTIIHEFQTANSIKFKLTKDTSGYYKCISSNKMGSIEKIINISYYGKLKLIGGLNMNSLKERFILMKVCKNWNSIVINQDSLFCHFDIYPQNLRWSSTNELIGFNNSFEIKNLNFLQHDLTKIYFKHIKKLIIFNLDFGRAGIVSFEKYIGHFQELIQLELNGFNFKDKSVLNFPNLRILTLKDVSINNSNYIIELITPELEIFVCWKKIYNIRFNQKPNKLKYLECVNDVSDLNYQLKFDNLEILNYYDVSGSMRHDFLANLPKLKKLNLFNNFNENDLLRLKNTKLDYGLNDLEIQFLGFKENIYVTPTIGYNFSYMLQKRNIKNLIENYDYLIDQTPWPVYIDYIELETQFNHTIPNSFFNKFINLNSIHIGKIENKIKLIDFLNKCGYIQLLRISYSNLDQNFFNSLEFLSISILEITDENVGKIDDFKFLSRLKIFQLKIRFDKLPIDLIYNRLINNKLKYFNFKRECFNLSISCLDDQFHLNIDRKSLTKFNEINDVINFLKKDKKTKEFIKL